MQLNGQQLTLDTRAQEYQEQLENRTDPRGPLTYLAEHGITERSILEKYRIGCVLDALPNDERFKGSLSIPYLSKRGNTISLKYRCCLPHKCKEIPGHAKYDKYRGDRTTLFNCAAFFGGEEYIGITEGEIDAIVATEILGIPTVGVPGATQWGGERADVWRTCFKEYDKVFVFADGDDAGLKFGRTVAGDIGPKAVLVKCDEEQDVSSMVVSGKLNDLRKRCGLPELYNNDMALPEPEQELVADGAKT